MALLKRHFPYSLTSSVLLANLCWEFAMSWDKDVTQLDSLAAALTVLRQIPMKNMRHGKCAFTLFFQTTPTTLKCKYSFRFTCTPLRLFNRRLLLAVDTSHKKKNGSSGKIDEQTRKVAQREIMYARHRFI